MVKKNIHLPYKNRCSDVTSNRSLTLHDFGGQQHLMLANLVRTLTRVCEDSCVSQPIVSTPSWRLNRRSIFARKTNDILGVVQFFTRLLEHVNRHSNNWILQLLNRVLLSKFNSCQLEYWRLWTRQNNWTWRCWLFGRYFVISPAQ